VAQALLVALAVALALVLGGCADSKHPTPQAQALERADLLSVARALSEVQAPVAREVAAAKAAWPLIAAGLPAELSDSSRTLIETASQRAAALPLPALFAEQQAASITGPGSSLAGLYRDFAVLAGRSWRLIAATLAQDEHGSTAAVRFARANVNLYIESVYDAHFTLAQIGKKLLAGYSKQGGPQAFGTSLTQAEVSALAASYSEASDRLYPHNSARLGT
jgi:hypothetical protein